MKNTQKFKLIILLLLSSNFAALSQNDEKCKKCKDQIQIKHLNRFTDTSEKLKLINDNWNESFFTKIWDTDLSNKFKNTSSLRFDGLGCIYPEVDATSEIELQYKRIYKKGNNNYIDGNSFYKISENANNSTMENFWLKYLKTDKAKIIVEKIDNSAPDFKPQMDFYNYWNKYYLENKINELNNIINNQNKKKLVFIVHGYNVPYSLAIIQHENIIQKYLEISDTTNTLFLPVYWPSTDRKVCTKNNDKFFFRNKITIRSIREYDKIMFRTLIVGASLRQIINSIVKVSEIQFIGHSLGAGVITSAVIPPINYLKFESSERYKLLSTIPIKPNSDIVRIFLNAPAIGKKIFEDIALIDKPILKNIEWFVGINSTDRVLARPKLIRKLFPKDNDNTRLGANMFKETELAKLIFDKLTINNNFIFDKTGKQRDLFGHDFFCYLIQPDFQKQFENFVLNKKLELSVTNP